MTIAYDPRPTSAWTALESFPGLESLPCYWQELAGDQYEALKLLCLQQGPYVTRSYPCPDFCGCAHTLAPPIASIGAQPANFPLTAHCSCEPPTCPDFIVTLADALTLEVSWPRLSRSICGTLELHSAPSVIPLTSTGQIGFWPPANTPAILTIQSSAKDQDLIVATLVATLSQPFILIAPTAQYMTFLSRKLIADNEALFLPLDTTVLLADDGTLHARARPASLFAHMLPRLPDSTAALLGRTAGEPSGAILKEIHQEIAAVRKDFHEMQTIKQRLEQMQGEKLFAFSNGIDPESFRLFCAILAGGDLAKASRALNESDSTLRSRVADWRSRGPAYKVLIELVRWRKEIGHRGTVPLNESISRGTAASTDFPGLLADVLDEVLSMDEQNWDEKAETLATLLRPYVER